MDRLHLQVLFSHKIDDLKIGLSDKTTRIISNKLIKRTINNLEKALKLLDSEVSRGKITVESKKKIYSLISNKSLKEYMGLFIAEFEGHNMDYLCIETCNRIRNDLSDYQNVLKKYRIDVSDLTEQIIHKYSVEELDYLLDKLTFKYGVKGAEAYRILFYSDVYRVYHVLNLMSEHQFVFFRASEIDNFLFKMCDLNSDACDNFEVNMGFLSMIDVNPIMDYYVVYRLICNIRIITDNYLTLSEYDLFDDVKKIDKIKKSRDAILFILLTTDNLEKKLDNILEMGCYDFVKNNLFSLSNDNTKRLQVLKCIGTPVVDQETYDITMTSDNFILEDNEFDEEMYSAVDIHDNVRLNIKFEDLEQFRCSENKLLYDIGGVLVSVNKVRRLLDEGKDIYTSITSGLILSDDEYNSMMDVLQPLQYIKK